MNLSAEKAFVTPAGGWGSSISEKVPRDGPDVSGRRVPPVKKGAFSRALGGDRSQSVFYFVPHSQAGSTSWGETQKGDGFYVSALRLPSSKCRVQFLRIAFPI